MKKLLNLGLLATLCLAPFAAHADVSPKIKQTLTDLQVDNYEVVDENANTTVIFNDKVGLITFFDNGNKFTTGTVFEVKNGHLFNIFGAKLVKELSPLKDKFINLNAPKNTEIGHVFIYFNINCPHCHHLIGDWQSYLNRGISITFVPLSSPRNATEVGQMSYILNLPDDKRFKELNQPAVNIKTDSNTNPLVNQAFTIARKYGVDSYPYIVFENGYILNGAVPADVIESYMMRFKEDSKADDKKADAKADKKAK